MVLGLLVGMCMVAPPAWAFRMEKPQTLQEWDSNTFTKLNDMLLSLWNVSNGLYQTDTLASNPNGNRKCTKGELIQATFSGNDNLCTCTTTGTTWKCVTMGSVAAAASVISVAASNTTEQTTTSTSADTTLVTFSNLNIPATDHVLIMGNARKTSGAAAGGRLGLSVNGTLVLSTANFACFGSANAAESGSFFYLMPPRKTNYLAGGWAHFARSTAGGSTDTSISDGNWPTGAVTTIVITGASGNSSITLGVEDITVYDITG